MVVCFNVLQNKVYARHLGHLSIEAHYIPHICSDTRPYHIELSISSTTRNCSTAWTARNYGRRSGTMEYPKSLTPWYAPLSKAWFSGMPLLVKCLSFEVKTDVRQGCLLSSFLFPSVINGSLGGYHKQEQSYIMDILNATRWSRICRWPGICKSQPQSDAGQNISSCNQNSSKRTLCQHEENRTTLSN